MYEVVGDLVTVLEAMHLVPDSVPEEHVYVRVAPMVMGVVETGVVEVGADEFVDPTVTYAFTAKPLDEEVQ